LPRRFAPRNDKLFNNYFEIIEIIQIFV